MADIKLQLFSKLRKQNPKTFFYVSRETDFKVVSFEVIRQNNRLADTVCNYSILDITKPESEPTAVPNVLIENFYGFTKPVKTGTNTYSTSIHAIPDRKITIRLGKNSTSMISRVGEVQNAVLVCVHLYMSFDKMIPKMDKVMILGLDPVSREPVQEYLDVTPEMTARFDTRQIISSYISG